MRVETISERDDLVIGRQVLEPGEAGPWHTDPCTRFSVVVRGERLRIEFRDTPECGDVPVEPGMAGWEPPEPRAHRAVNVGRAPFEEVVTFYLEEAGSDPQPRAADQ